MREVLARLIASVLCCAMVLFGWLGSASMASVAADLPATTYTYDSPAASSTLAATNCDRGPPPAATSPSQRADAIGLATAASRLDAPAFTYDTPAWLTLLDKHASYNSCTGVKPGGDRVVASSLASTGVAANGADEAFSAGRYLKDTWYKSTFPNRTQSVQYHLAKHGKGRTAVQYTQDAMDFFAQNRSLGQSVILRDGTAGIKIATKQPRPGGGVQRVGGYWTSDGRLVTYWD